MTAEDPSLILTGEVPNYFGGSADNDSLLTEEEDGEDSHFEIPTLTHSLTYAQRPSDKESKTLSPSACSVVAEVVPQTLQ